MFGCSTDNEKRDDEKITDYLEHKRLSDDIRKRKEISPKQKSFSIGKKRIGNYEIVKKISETKSIEKFIGVKKNSNKKYEITTVRTSKTLLSLVEHFADYFRLYRNLDNILDQFYFEGSVVYIFEHTESTLHFEFNQRFEKNLKFKFDELILIAYEIVYGLYILHKKEWIYGNCSINNIVKDLDGWKLKNFSIIDEYDLSEFPIEIEFEKYSFASDIFGIGIILLKLIICGQQEYKLIDKIDPILIKEFRNNYKKSNQYTKEMKEFISIVLQMIELNPKKRPDAKTLYQKFFKFYSTLKINQMEDFEFYQFLKMSEIPSFIRFYPIFTKIPHT
jgi:serine/threonine protein kinase